LKSSSLPRNMAGTWPGIWNYPVSSKSAKVGGATYTLVRIIHREIQYLLLTFVTWRNMTLQSFHSGCCCEIPYNTAQTSKPQYYIYLEILKIQVRKQRNKNLWPNNSWCILPEYIYSKMFLHIPGIVILCHDFLYKWKKIIEKVETDSWIPHIWLVLQKRS
jgi:hypothetical protein